MFVKLTFLADSPEECVDDRVTGHVNRLGGNSLLQQVLGGTLGRRTM